ncbi:MAG: TonB-dependent receptor [Prevotellaceae bacterium]|jgi:TonB-linked SusC/RagA family outer membrane protein|nr:TonB-dependent receptor [Prevotellaceae bacterium]
MKKVIFSLVVMAFMTLPSVAQNVLQVKGVVKDADTGEPLIGVAVMEAGTQSGAVTDLDGQFTLSATAGSSLQFSYVGYKTLTLAARASMEVKLQQDVEVLNEVLVVGYGTVKRRDVTTAVASVSTKEISQRPIVSAAQAIQGKAAGVQVIQPNGAPGGETVIRVRGTTSFNGSNDPLYVVDGVPVDNLNFLSPNDIASMQILKDASSAAIYGSRGANGVVIITTKSGETSNAKISLSAQLTLNNVSNQIRSLNAKQYKELMDEIRPGAIPDGTRDITNWYDEVYRTGITQNYQVSISDKGERMSYFVSAGYLNEGGTLEAAFFRRYNFRANIESDVTKWLHLNANISYSDNQSNGITTGMGSNRGGVVLAVVNLPTSLPVWNTETNYYNRTFYGQNITNPVESMRNGKDDISRENRLIASASATITFLPELKYKGSFTLDRRSAIADGFSPVVHVTGIDEWGSGWDNRNQNTVLTFDNVLTYNKVFAKRHTLEVMLGTSWTDSDYRNNYINGSYYRDNLIHTLNAANKIAWDNTGAGISQWGIFSYFGRLSYNYEGKYLFTGNVRRDGSSNLAPNHRWGTFPSFSAAWRLSSEQFMQGMTWLDDLKIRGGWGQTGNQSGIGDYAYLQAYNITRQPWAQASLDAGGNIVYLYDKAAPLITASGLRTRDLTWETTSQTSIGLDATLFNNRLSVTMDYYYKYTKNMLMYVSLPAGASFSSITRNEGEMSNQGFELSITSHNFTGKVFTWDTSLNLSTNKNRLKKLELQQIYYDAQTTDAFHQMNVVRNEPGRPLGGFFGYISDGVDPETGELRYRDLNKDGKLTATDRTYIGNPNPDLIYGMTNTFAWKNINLSIFLQGTLGNDVFNASKGDTEGMYDLKNQSVNVLRRWRTPGMITDVPKANFNMQPSSYFVEDGSYLRVKDITLSYNLRLPQLKKIGISLIRPYLTATNLITFTNYSGMDPEVNQWGNNGHVQGIDWGTYPQNRSWVFGLNVEF